MRVNNSSTLDSFDWFRGHVTQVFEVDERKSSAEIHYDDGDVYRDYFDGRPGALQYKKIELMI